jgi:hypothetical protein
VFAALLLTTAPTEIRVFKEHTLMVTFPSVADLREWLTREGLDTPGLITGEDTYTDHDGQTYHYLTAYPRDWHGWQIRAEGRDYLSTTPLDEATTVALTALTEPAGTAQPVTA